MKLSELQSVLNQIDTVNFQLPDASFVPQHFHITEAGLVTKHFIDCGGTVRKETAVTMQLWAAEDYQHRLTPDKLKKILSKAKPLFGEQDYDIEIEYQSDTIGRYGVKFDGNHFQLTKKHTDCLAKESCGTGPGTENGKSTMAPLSVGEPVSACTPGGGCC